MLIGIAVNGVAAGTGLASEGMHHLKGKNKGAKGQRADVSPAQNSRKGSDESPILGEGDEE